MWTKQLFLFEREIDFCYPVEHIIVLRQSIIVEAVMKTDIIDELISFFFSTRLMIVSSWHMAKIAFSPRLNWEHCSEGGAEIIGFIVVRNPSSSYFCDTASNGIWQIYKSGVEN